MRAKQKKGVLFEGHSYTLENKCDFVLFFSKENNTISFNFFIMSCILLLLKYDENYYLENVSVYKYFTYNKSIVPLKNLRIQSTP